MKFNISSGYLSVNIYATSETPRQKTAVNQNLLKDPDLNSHQNGGQSSTYNTNYTTQELELGKL